MPKTRPPYAPEFRQQMVDLVRSGRDAQDLARRFTALVRASGVGRAATPGRNAAAELDAWITTAKACSERTQRLIDQYELQLEELEASAAADALAAEKAAAKAAVPAPTERRKPSRQPFPAQLPRVRVVVPAPTACPCCGGARLSKLGEDVTETLEVVPRQWTVIQTVRGRFSCRACESITQAPAPFHAIPRGWAGPSLLAMVLFEKFGQHVPLNRQAERYAREGVPLSLSTLADQVGTCAGVLEPLFRLIERHVRAAGRLHGDDTTVPVLAKGKTSTGRVWVYVRDDRPSAAAIPRQPCSISRPTGAASTRRPTSRAGPGCCRPTPTGATASCTRASASPRRSSRPRVGPTGGESSSSWPTSRPQRARGLRRRWR